jgi:hypothetical protein
MKKSDKPKSKKTNRKTQIKKNVKKSKTRKLRSRNNKRFQKYIGGIRISSAYTPESAINMFLQNSTFKILTDNSISCITVLATLNAGIDSPYQMVRTHNVDEPVTKLLLKLFIWGPGTEKSEICNINLRDSVVYNSTIEITPTNNILQEARMQQDVFLRSFYNDFLEPICPAILFVHANKLSTQDNKLLCDKIINHMTERDRDPRRPLRPLDKTIIHELFNYDVAFVAMEFMDDYKTLYELQNSNHKDKFNQMALYELDKLHKYGYYHGDFHLGNVMINPEYKLFTDIEDVTKIGKALVIDFGRAMPLLNNEYTTDRYKLLIREINPNAIQIPANIDTIFTNMDWCRANSRDYSIQKIEREFKISITDIQSTLRSYKFYQAGKYIDTTRIEIPKKQNVIDTVKMVENKIHRMIDVTDEEYIESKIRSGNDSIYGSPEEQRKKIRIVLESLKNAKPVKPGDPKPYSKWHEDRAKEWAQSLEEMFTDEAMAESLKRWSVRESPEEIAASKSSTIENLDTTSLERFTDLLSSAFEPMYVYNSPINEDEIECGEDEEVFLGIVSKKSK